MQFALLCLGLFLILGGGHSERRGHFAEQSLVGSVPEVGIRQGLPPVRGELPWMADVSLTQLRVRDAAIDVAFLNPDAEVDLGLAFEAKPSGAALAG